MTTLVAWCSGCQWYVEVEQAGMRCPGDECGRILRKRRGSICERCEERPIFLDALGYAVHLAEHARDDADARVLLVSAP